MAYEVIKCLNLGTCNKPDGMVFSRFKADNPGADFMQPPSEYNAKFGVADKTKDIGFTGPT